MTDGERCLLKALAHMVSFYCARRDRSELEAYQGEVLDNLAMSPGERAMEQLAARGLLVAIDHRHARWTPEGIALLKE